MPFLSITAYKLYQQKQIVRLFDTCSLCLHGLKMQAVFEHVVEVIHFPIVPGNELLVGFSYRSDLPVNAVEPKRIDVPVVFP
jgi:hypothetical protein